MRLNKEIKEQILNNAIKKSPIIAEAEKLISERAEIDEKLRRQFVSEKDESEILEAAKKLKFLGERTGIDLCVYNHKSYEIQININGHRHDLPFNGYQYSVSAKILKQYAKKSCKKIVSFMHRYVVTDDCGLLENEKNCDALMARYDSLTTQVRAILSKCSTDGQLLKLWPESVELIPKDIAKPSTALMVKTDQLNAALGLPSKKQ